MLHTKVSKKGVFLHEKLNASMQKFPEWSHLEAHLCPLQSLLILKMNLSSEENSNSSKGDHLLYHHQVFSKHNQEAAT